MNIRKKLYYSGASYDPLLGWNGNILISDKGDTDTRLIANIYGVTKQEVDSIAAAFINLNIK